MRKDAQEKKALIASVPGSIGSILGALQAPKGKTMEGTGRGLVRGSATGIGAGLGGVAGSVLGAGLGGVSGAALPHIIAAIAGKKADPVASHLAMLSGSQLGSGLGALGGAGLGGYGGYHLSGKAIGKPSWESASGLEGEPEDEPKQENKKAAAHTPIGKWLQKWAAYKAKQDDDEKLKKYERGRRVQQIRIGSGGTARFHEETNAKAASCGDCGGAVHTMPGDSKATKAKKQQHPKYKPVTKLGAWLHSRMQSDQASEKAASDGFTMIMSTTRISGKGPLPKKLASMFKRIPSIDPGDHKTPSVTDMAKDKDKKGAKVVDIS